MYRSLDFSMQNSPVRPSKVRSGELTAAAYTERPAMMPSQRRVSAPHNTMMMPPQQQHHTRLYKAPQPTIRNLPDVSNASSAMAAGSAASSMTPTAMNLHAPINHHNNNNSTESKTGYARRRRQTSNTKPIPSLEGGGGGMTTTTATGTGFRGRLERQNSNGSMSDAELMQVSTRSSRSEDMFHSVPDGLVWKPSYGPNSNESNRGGGRGGGTHLSLDDRADLSSKHSANNNNNSLFVSDRQHQQSQKRTKHSAGSSLWLCQVRSFFTPIHFLQLLALLCLTGMIYDSHHKVKAHRSRLNQYDEERSHILEQMMWMDKAAKKVHAASAANNPPTDLHSLDALQKQNKQLQEQLDHMQVRIQLNARDRIHERYDNKPIAVTLQLKLATELPDEHGQREREVPIVLELSDDTPHAVNVLLQQIDNHQWNNMIFETIQPGVVQVSSRSATGSPLLEFVEDSRSCNTAGSVALHEAVVDQLIHVLYLRIYLQDNAILSPDDVCIGRVSSGLELLHQVPTSSEGDQ